MPEPINAPHLPPWIPPQQTSQPSRSDVNSTGIERSRQQASVSAEGTILPIIYGEDYIGPIISLVRATETSLILRCIWCLGEIEEIVSITDESGESIEGMTVRNYTGRLDQGVDPTLAAIIPGYADRCVVPLGNEWFGVAYSVVTIPANANVGFPRLRARIKGMKVRDPRGIPWTTYGFSQRFDQTSSRLAIAFNGTGHTYNDSQGYTAVTPIANSGKGTVFGVVNAAVSGSSQTIFDAGDGKFRISVGVDRKMRVIAKNAANTVVMSMTSIDEVPSTGSVAFMASWDLSVARIHLFFGRNDTQLPGSTLVSSQIIDYAAGGMGLGGNYTGSAEKLHGDLAAFGFIEDYYDFAYAENIDVFMDINGNLKVPSPTKAIWALDGYDPSLTYPIAPTVMNVLPSGWTSTTPDRDNYAYPAYGGKGTYFKSNSTAFTISSSTTIEELTQRVYFAIEPIQGGAHLTSSTLSLLMDLDAANPENIINFQFDSADGLILNGTSASANEFVIKALYVSPVPLDADFRFYNLSGWTVAAGSVTTDASSGGVSSTNATLTTSATQFLSGEKLKYEFEVSGTFTGTVQLKSGADVIEEVTAPGLYSGYFISEGTASRTLTLQWATAGTATVKSLKVSTNTITKVFTKTPSLMLTDLIESKAYGLGGRVNDLSLLKCLQYNEERLIGPLDRVEMRHEVGITLAQSQNITSWIETFRAYARCFIVPRGNEYFLVKDSTVAGPYESITASQIVSSTFNLQKKALVNLPNVVKVYYTNTAVEPWSEDFVEAVSPRVERGEEYRRESVLRMSGIQTRSMATRIAIERLNDATLIDLMGSFSAFDIAFPIEIGDVIKISHPIGLTDKLVRVLGSDSTERGKVGISFAEYDENVYSSSIVDEVPPPDYGGLTPFNVPSITNLTASEQFFNNGMQTQSQITISWSPLAYPFLQYYVLEIYEDDVKILSIRTQDSSYYARTIQVGSTYRIRVFGVSSAYVPGEPSSAVVVAQGHLIPPNFDNGKIVAFEAGDAISAYVQVPAVDIDLWGYEWRYREISNNSYWPKAGPFFDAADWTLGASFWDFSYGSMLCNLSGNGTSSLPALTTSYLTPGKKYDVYLKVKKLKMKAGSTTGISIFLPGHVTADWFATADVTADKAITKPGLYVIKEWTCTLGNLVTNIQNVVDVFEFEIGYVGFRESDSDNDVDWEGATFFDRSPASTIRIPQVPGGDYLVYCRALDSVRSRENPYGQYSEHCPTDPVTIISDSAAYFRQAFTLAQGIDTFYYQLIEDRSDRKFEFHPSPTQLSSTPGFEALGTERVGWMVAADDTSAEWNTTFGSNIDSYSYPIYNYFTNGTDVEHSWTHQPIDLGVVTSGKIRYFMKVLIFPGGVSPKYELTYYDVAGGPTTTISDFDPFTATDVRCRYFQLRAFNPVSGSSTPANAIYRDADQRVEFIATPRVETGTVMTNGPDGFGDPQPLTVTLSNIYQSAISVRAYAQTGEPIQCYIDNITFGDLETTFDVISLNLAGHPIATTVSWEWKGV